MWTKTYKNQTVIYEFILLRSSLRENNDITTCLCLLRKHRKQRSHRDHWFHVEELNIPTQILDFPGSRDFEFFWTSQSVAWTDRAALWPTYGGTLAHIYDVGGRLLFHVTWAIIGFRRNFGIFLRRSGPRYSCQNYPWWPLRVPV